MRKQISLTLISVSVLATSGCRLGMNSMNSMDSSMGPNPNNPNPRTIIEPIQVSPREAVLLPGEEFQFDIQGGRGQFLFDSDDITGRVRGFNDGTFFAPTEEGRYVFTITDPVDETNTTNFTVTVSEPNPLRPNDFSNLYGMDKIGAPAAWAINNDCSEVVVGVIDSGLDLEHPDLVDNLWINEAEANGTEGEDDDGNGIIDDIHGARFINGVSSGDPEDDNYHGTHVAGTIGASGNNDDFVTGVCWKTQLMALKFLDDEGGGAFGDAISAMDYSVANGAHLTNNSWGLIVPAASLPIILGSNLMQAFEDAFQDAEDNGVLFVAAAGNEATDINDPEVESFPNGQPADIILSVASTDSQDLLSAFSNFGSTKVDLAAPGSFIKSTFPTSRTPAMVAEGYAANEETISGTSMAAPHVAGAAALIKAQFPEMTGLEIKELLMNSVDRLGSLTGLMQTGGRLNLSSAIKGETASSRGIGEFGPVFFTDEAVTVGVLPRPGVSGFVTPEINNLGDEVATDIKVTIALDDAFVSVAGSTSVEIPEIQPGQFVLDSLFELRISDDIPNGHITFFDLTVESEGGISQTIQSGFRITTD